MCSSVWQLCFHKIFLVLYMDVLLKQIQWSYCIHTVRMRNYIREDKHAGEATSYSRKKVYEYSHYAI